MGSGYCKSGSLASWDFLDHLRDWLKMEKELDVISLLKIGVFLDIISLLKIGVFLEPLGKRTT